MSTPLIWILIPGALAILLFLIRRWRSAVILIGIAAAFGLTVLAWLAPIGDEIRLGALTFQLDETFTLLGRRFVLGVNDRSLLILLYLGLTFWFGGVFWARVHRLFVPLGLAIVALLTAALAVEPSLYAALIIEIAVLVSVPLLAPPGIQAGRGVIRFITFQTLGFPFILFTGWLLEGANTGLIGSDAFLHAGILMAFGFWFLLGVFPLHSWIPLLAEESHPYAVAFVFYEFPLAIALLALGFLDRYAWLRADQNVFTLVQLVGVLMVIFGGLWSAFERHVGRMMGYALIIEIGLTLITASMLGDPLGGGRGLGMFFALLLPRGLSLGIWSLSLVAIANGMSKAKIGADVTSEDLRFRNIQGAARRFPIASTCLLLTQFSLAGFPLLAGFPVRLAIWEEMAQLSTVTAFALIFGSAGMMVAGMRTLAVLITGKEDNTWVITENWGERILFVLGGIVLVFIGIFPQLVTFQLVRMADMFINLGP